MIDDFARTLIKMLKWIINYPAHRFFFPETWNLNGLILIIILFEFQTYHFFENQLSHEIWVFTIRFTCSSSIICCSNMNMRMHVKQCYYQFVFKIFKCKLLKQHCCDDKILFDCLFVFWILYGLVLQLIIYIIYNRNFLAPKLIHSTGNPLA